MALAVSLHVLERTLNTTMQTLNKKTIGLLVCGLVLGFAHAATAATDEPNYRPFTISAEGGTTGLGGSASWRFSDNFGIRGGVNCFSYDTKELTYTTRAPGLSPDVDQKFDGTVRLLSEPLALDYYPSAKSSFRVSLGVLVNQNRFSATVKDSGVPDSLFVINGQGYFQSSLPELDLEVKQQSLSPYLSIGGSIYLDKGRRWSINGELGVAYTGSPKVSLTAPNAVPIVGTPEDQQLYNDQLQANLNAEAKSVEKDAKDFKFYPIVKIGVSYSF
jgi:hypothetical protein